MGTRIELTDSARNAIYTKVNQIADEKQDTLTFDNAPTSGSNNPVKSGGVYTALSGKQDVISDLSTIRSGATLGATAVQPTDLATVATTGAYSDLTGTPTIPTVNNATLTITQDGVTKGTFTANASSNVTVNLDGNERNIGEIVQSTIPLNDAGLHLLDGALISGSGSYSDFVDYMEDLFDENKIPHLYAWTRTYDNVDYIVYTKSLSIREDTVLYNADGSVYSSTDNIRFEIDETSSSQYVGYLVFLKVYSGSGGGSVGHSANWDSDYDILNLPLNMFCTESDWQAAVLANGVCDKYVYDTTNRTVRLPKYGDKFWSSTGIAGVKGNGNGLGVSDGTNEGSWLGAAGGTQNYSPRIYKNTYGEVGESGTTTNPQNNKIVGVVTDVTKSGLISDLSTLSTILCGYWYVVVATSEKTQIQVDIDEIATDLNGKADVDLSNSTVPHIVQTWHDDVGGWYRVWSDGWCEQGGFVTPANSSAGTIVTLSKAMIDTTYSVFLTENTLTSGNGCSVGDKTTTQFSARAANSSSVVPTAWEVKGYTSYIS